MRMLIAMLLAALLVAPAALAANSVDVTNARAYTAADSDWGLWGLVVYLSHLFVDEQASVSVTMLDTGAHRQVNREPANSRESYHVYSPYDTGLADGECDIARVRVKTNGKTSTRHFDVCNI